MPNDVTESALEATSRMFNLPLSPDRIAELAPRLQEYLTLFAKLDELDLHDVEPVTVHSADWR